MKILVVDIPRISRKDYPFGTLEPREGEGEHFLLFMNRSNDTKKKIK